jgi:hypothetical protein
MLHSKILWSKLEWQLRVPGSDVCSHSLWRQINAEKEALTKPKEDEASKKDYSLKEGETISINIGKAGVSFPWLTINIRN